MTNHHRLSLLAAVLIIGGCSTGSHEAPHGDHDAGHHHHHGHHHDAASHTHHRSSAPLPPDDDRTRAEVVRDTRVATERLFAALSPDQRTAIQYDFDDVEQQRRWSNLPIFMAPRGGLRMGDLTEAQQDAVWTVLESFLSRRGFRQVRDNVHGDEVLRHRGPREQTAFGEDEFYVSILGEPSPATPWMVQFGGHHLAINATFVGDRITLAPSLTGGQPVRYERGSRDVELLGEDWAAARALLESLTPEQRAEAVLADRPADLAFGPTTTTNQPRLEGLPGSAMTETQLDLLRAVIRARVGLLHPSHAAAAMERIEPDLAETWFAWFGSTDPADAASYRVQGPTVIIEYAPQQRGGGPVDHLHAMFRDPTNDYGAADRAAWRGEREADGGS